MLGTSPEAEVVQRPSQQRNYQKKVIQGQIQDLFLLTSPAIYTT